MFLALIEPPSIMTLSPMFNPLWKARFRKKLQKLFIFMILQLYALVKSNRSFEGKDCKEARLRAKKERAERQEMFESSFKNDGNHTVTMITHNFKKRLTIFMN
jgi:hypothetical protein